MHIPPEDKVAVGKLGVGDNCVRDEVRKLRRYSQDALELITKLKN